MTSTLPDQDVNPRPTGGAKGGASGETALDAADRMPVDASERAAVGETPALRIEVPLGRRVMVLGDLLLVADPPPAAAALAGDVARNLEGWQGPGLVIVTGNVFDAPAGRGPLTGEEAEAALGAHPELVRAITTFTRRADCRLVVLPGWRDPEIVTDPAVRAVLCRLGIEVAPSVELDLLVATGTRRVLVQAGPPPAAPSGALVEPSRERRPWLSGLDRLEDPASSARFVTSRLLYHRFGRYAWWLFIPAALALVVRLPWVYEQLLDLFGRSPGPRHALSHAFSASWPSRLTITCGATLAVVLVFVALLGVLSRRLWIELGGEPLPAPWRRRSDPGAELELRGRRPDDDQPFDHEPLDAARAAVADGFTGLIAGGSLRAELTHLGPGFSACPGGVTEVVREHTGHAGLPPVFLRHCQSGWVELETGADLHVRLLRAESALPSSTLLERLVSVDPVVKGYKPAADLHPAMVASWPRGAPWPPAPDTSAERARARWVRRLVAAAISFAGVVDLLIAITPPLRGRLHLVEHYLPLGIAQAAGALVALAGIGLLMLARGALRGQRRAWVVSIGLLSATLVLHAIHGASFSGLTFSFGVLLLLLLERRWFQAPADPVSLRTAVAVVVLGGLAAITTATVTIELSHPRHHHQLPSWPLAALGSAERLVGIQAVAFPSRMNGFISPSLLGVGVALIVVALYLSTRPVVDRGLSSVRVSTRRVAESRARDIIRRHGSGTLDYFALRDDKRWFFHRDSVVAYAVYGGVCLVSPDPVGPPSERTHVWEAFRRHAERHGWSVGIMAAAEEWLPIYRESGMRHVYIGDEAVVDVQSFSLQGGKMKGLRQACSRIARYGYTVRCLDPAGLDPATTAALLELMGRNRRGDDERGFSMVLGRIFDPRDTGLLLTVVSGPDGAPAAMCQFVPSEAIGGYSLDLMRRDPGEHPNGLIDFALCSTIEHLRTEGQRGLSLNFAALRTTLEGENGDGLTRRVERWALRRLSGVLQIESLWRFNAKYEPTWLPRYVVFDSAEQFVPTVTQILRAESLTEVPVVGRLLNTTGRPTASVERR